jgi:two-component system cell cycle sensor histidine kinase/response regulator CckA
VAALLQGEPIVRIEKRYRRGDGSLASVQVTGALLTDGDGAPRQVITVVQDVTEQRRLEHELLQSMKMDAVGQLAGGVAHDFNNLLAGIIGYAELLEHDAGSSDEVREDAGAIRRTASRGADLARSLLTLARRNPHREEPFALDAMLRETVDLIRRTFDRRIEVHASVELHATIRGRSLPALQRPAQPRAQRARRDAHRRHTAHHRGGVESEHHVPCAPWCAGRRTHGLHHVRDSGAGMPPDVLRRVFEPFFTTKETGKGTGLGLAMVYGTIKDHRGTIVLESAPDEGTTARVFLPCTMDGVAPSLSERTIIPAAPGVRVLVVDDEDLVRDVAVRMLHRLGYDVEAVEDGIRAIERLDRDDHGFTVVLLDGNMPRLNGIETARRVHARHPALALVYASGFFDPADQEDLPSSASGSAW